MRFIDLLDDEYLQIRGSILKRMDEVPEKKLREHSERYQKLYKERDTLYNKYEFIVNLVENNLPDKEVYTREDIIALKNYFECAREMEDYERLELYKLGYHDCMFWLYLIDILQKEFMYQENLFSLGSPFSIKDEELTL